MALVMCGKDAVSTGYLSGKRLSFGNRNVAAFEIGESATAAAHQRRGLFSKVVTACTERAFEMGASVVYGTPNDQSRPGYGKLGFDIVTDRSSWLFALVDVYYWLPSFVPGLPTFGRRKISELTLDAYIEKTSSFTRLNVGDREYLSWRFAPGTMNYRFFEVSSGTDIFLFAAKPGTLGRFPMVVCSEYFLNGRKPSLPVARPLLRKAVSKGFEKGSYAGIYLQCALPAGFGRLIQAAFGAFAHRELTVCAKFRQPNDPRPNWFEHFQLSDCDIG